MKYNIEILKTPIFWLTLVVSLSFSYFLYNWLWNAPSAYSDASNMSPARLPYCLSCSFFELVIVTVGVSRIRKNAGFSYGLLFSAAIVTIGWFLQIVQIYIEAR